VPGISHVINFDVPMQAEDYVHRIGRTGRAGREGISFTLAHHREHGRIKGIERYTGSPIPVATLPGLEPRDRPSHPGKSGRKNSNWKPGHGTSPPGPGGDPGKWGKKREFSPLSRERPGETKGQGEKRPVFSGKRSWVKN
jgi:superfamily II DNA/RNA helicase